MFKISNPVNPVPHLAVTPAQFTNEDLSEMLNGVHCSIISRDRAALGIPPVVPMTYNQASQVYMMRTWLYLMFLATGVYPKRKTYIRLATQDPHSVIGMVQASGGGPEDFAQLVQKRNIRKLTA